MYQVTAAEVNILRKKTSSGMMDCKKALVEASGDVDKAIELLRKKGQKIAFNRSDREINKGAAIAKVNTYHTTGAILTLGCETDFVAKNKGFVKLASDLAEIALSCNSQEALLNALLDGISVQNKCIEQTGVIGEKISIKAFEKLQAPFVSSYIHMGNKIATLVGFSEPLVGIEEVARNVAMQVAAMNPLGLDEKDISPDLIEKELEIIKDQLRKEGKPEQVAQEKLKFFFSESTLMHQAFIKNQKITVGDYIKNFSPDLKVIGFKRLII
ncbi:MAG: translation elongation factor Ts [Flavobacteriales bacterium Tduv]